MSGRPRVVEPDVAPEEKETIIRFGKVEDRAVVYSEHRGVVSRLLRHPQSEAAAITLHDGSRVEDTDALGEDDTVVAYRGTVPIGSVKVRKNARESAQRSKVVSLMGADE